MANAPENPVLKLSHEMRGDISRVGATLDDVQRTVVSLDMPMEALDEKFEMVREGAVSAIGFAANAGRAHVELRKQIAELTKRVEKLEKTK